MRTLSLLILLGSFAWPVAAQAEPVSTMRSEYRLTDEEKEKVLEEAAAAARRQAAPIAAESERDGEAPLSAHGEVGFTVGSGGYRSAYGTAIVPLKNDGVAILSVGTTDLGSRGRYYGPRWR